MRQKTNNSEVKKLNRNRVFRYIKGQDKISMPDIAAGLDMSVPTVLQIVKELKAEGVVQEVGELQSTGGRKPKALAVVEDICYAVGIDITKNHISLVLTDLKETTLKHLRIRKAFSLEDDYFKQLGIMLEDFLAEDEVVKAKIAGAGIAIPSIVDGKKNRITYSRILELYNNDGALFAKYIPYPSILLNDASAAAMTECLWGEHGKEMVYLSLSNTVGGAILSGQKQMENGNLYGSFFENMYIGTHWHSGEFGHMVIYPEGKTCYCGKRGCLDAYCSALCLSGHADENLQEFFVRMEAGDIKLQKIWDIYLDNLAIAVDNLRMCYDCDVILGGYVGSMIEPYIDQLRTKVGEKNIFEGGGSYVYACRYQQEASALGAAMFYIEDFIDSI